MQPSRVQEQVKREAAVKAAVAEGLEVDEVEDDAANPVCPD